MTALRWRRDTYTKWRSGAHLARPRSSIVYFVECAEADAIKIGFTVNLDQRMTALQIASPYELKLVGTAPGGIEHESRLHWLFHREHIRGEWFRNSGHLRTMIDALMRLPAAQRTAVIEREPSVPDGICRPEADAEAREDLKRLVEVIAEEKGVMVACELYLRAWLR